MPQNQDNQNNKDNQNQKSNQDNKNNNKKLLPLNNNSVNNYPDNIPINTVIDIINYLYFM